MKYSLNLQLFFYEWESHLRLPIRLVELQAMPEYPLKSTQLAFHWTTFCH